MALIEYRFLPGVDKQSSDTGAENRWIDSDNVRFRYGLPEKVGGWSSLVTEHNCRCSKSYACFYRFNR